MHRYIDRKGVPRTSGWPERHIQLLGLNALALCAFFLCACYLPSPLLHTKLKPASFSIVIGPRSTTITIDKFATCVFLTHTHLSTNGRCRRFFNPTFLQQIGQLDCVFNTLWIRLLQLFDGFFCFKLIDTTNTNIHAMFNLSSAQCTLAVFFDDDCDAI